MKKKVSSLFLGLSLMIGLAVLAACGATLEPTLSPEPTSPPPTATATPPPPTATATPTQTPPPPPTATATPTPPPFTATPTVDPYILALEGTYEVIMPDDSLWPGQWTFKFSRTGVMMSNYNEITRKHPFSVSENQIVFSKSELCGVVPGKYEWSLDGDTLTLEVISDSCENRRDMLVQPRTRID